MGGIGGGQSAGSGNVSQRKREERICDELCGKDENDWCEDSSRKMRAYPDLASATNPSVD